VQIIWNSSTRAELLKFVDQQRAAQGPDGSYDIKDSHEFVYEALSKELFIGNVYLRVYNDQPDFEISEPEAFCVALVDYISWLLHNQCVEEPNHDVEETTSFTETPEHPNEAVDGSVNEHQILNNSSIMSDEQSVVKEEPELIKNLRSALISLQVDF
jgi:DnaJ family protein C protein 13